MRMSHFGSLRFIPPRINLSRPLKYLVLCATAVSAVRFCRALCHFARPTRPWHTINPHAVRSPSVPMVSSQELRTARKTLVCELPESRFLGYNLGRENSVWIDSGEFPERFQKTWQAVYSISPVMWRS